MKLYYSPGACSLASHIALNETGLQYTAEEVDLKKHEWHGHSFYDINKKGYVPVLELDDGQILTENAIILQYIADLKPDSGLLPKPGDFKRYRVEEWVNFIATEVHKGFGPYFNPMATDDEKQRAKERIYSKFDIIQAGLEKNKFLAGNEVTIADFYLFVMLMWAKRNKMELEKWPAFRPFMETLMQRPSVSEALKQEKLQLVQ